MSCNTTQIFFNKISILVHLRYSTCEQIKHCWCGTCSPQLFPPLPNLARGAHWSEGVPGSTEALPVCGWETANASILPLAESSPPLGVHPLLRLHWLPLLPGLSVADAHSLGNARMASPPWLPSRRRLGGITFPYSDLIKWQEKRIPLFMGPQWNCCKTEIRWPGFLSP